MMHKAGGHHPQSLPPTDHISGRQHRVDHRGIQLSVWEKYKTDRAAKPVVVLAHGSATAGRESFDLKVPGKPSYSLMDYLAGIGFDVFAPDIRGFGRSTHPGGHLDTRQASDDLNAVVDYVTALRGVGAVSLLGWSWGTQYGGLFVMAHHAKVNRYISYAQMHANSPDIVQRRAKADLFRENVYLKIPVQGWKTRFYAQTPESANDPEVVDCYADTASKTEPMSPTGPHLDMISRLPMVDARRIPVPTMIIHGEFDDVADTEGLFPFFSQLPNADKRYIIIPRAGHMMHLQQGHRQFQHEVGNFLSTDCR